MLAQAASPSSPPGPQAASGSSPSTKGKKLVARIGAPRGDLLVLVLFLVDLLAGDLEPRHLREHDLPRPVDDDLQLLALVVLVLVDGDDAAHHHELAPPLRDAGRREHVLVEEDDREVAEHLAAEQHLGRAAVAEPDLADRAEHGDLL